MRLLFVLLLAFVLNSAYAQRIINGTLTDAVTGEKIKGATITVSSTGQKIKADDEGRFIISLPSDTSRIIISAPGKSDLAIRPGKAVTLDLMLDPAIEYVPSVVPVPPFVRAAYPPPHGAMPLPSYGWHWKPGIVPDSLLFRPGIVDDPAQLLQGITPGLLVSKGGTDPNENYVMRSRGLSSMIGNNQPQVWIDGVPAGDFFLLRSEDIASIRVLRSAAETALYGPGAAAG
ncbi:MAG: TonB-dependent receptor plug domain-containing protein, partial [Saprospiraceae bacterium]|nr:TonB-dependent receptor plug domain-containing protein [Saprospiraceae bacterium]